MKAPMLLILFLLLSCVSRDIEQTHLDVKKIAQEADNRNFGQELTTQRLQDDELSAYLIDKSFFQGRGYNKDLYLAKSEALSDLAKNIQVHVTSEITVRAVSSIDGEDEFTFEMANTARSNITLPGLDKQFVDKIDNDFYEVHVFLSRQRLEHFENNLKLGLERYLSSELTFIRQYPIVTQIILLNGLLDELMQSGFSNEIFYEKDSLYVSVILNKIRTLYEGLRIIDVDTPTIANRESVLKLRVYHINDDSTLGQLPFTIKVKDEEREYTLERKTNTDGNYDENIFRTISPAAKLAYIEVIIDPLLIDKAMQYVNLSKKIHLLPKIEIVVVKGVSQGIFIPSGEYWVGALPSDVLAYENEKNRRKMFFDAFFIDQNLVTNAEYAIFLENNPEVSPPLPYWNSPRFNQPNQPVVGVTWEEANLYARWVGKRLPTEWEWEIAAKSLGDNRFTWGDSIAAGTTHANHLDSPFFQMQTSPSMFFNANPLGLYDMTGNVWQWTASRYEDQNGNRRVVRGGSWIDNLEDLRTTNRRDFDINQRLHNVGFRCVQDVE